jgi:hypothetical protein
MFMTPVNPGLALPVPAPRSATTCTRRGGRKRSCKRRSTRRGNATRYGRDTRETKAFLETLATTGMDPSPYIRVSYASPYVSTDRSGDGGGAGGGAGPRGGGQPGAPGGQ